MNSASACLRCIGKGRNPYSQITILKAIVQATGDSLNARVSESHGISWGVVVSRVQQRAEKTQLVGL